MKINKKMKIHILLYLPHIKLILIKTDTIKTHHGIDRRNSALILPIDKITLTRMCLAVSATNVKARIIEGKLDNLPEPTTVYPKNEEKINSSNLKLFFNKIDNKFSKYDDYYEYVDKITSQIKLKTTEKTKSLKKQKQDNSICVLQ